MAHVAPEAARTEAPLAAPRCDFGWGGFACEQNILFQSFFAYVITRWYILLGMLFMVGFDVIVAIYMHASTKPPLRAHTHHIIRHCFCLGLLLIFILFSFWPSVFDDEWFWSMLALLAVPAAVELVGYFLDMANPAIRRTCRCHHLTPAVHDQVVLKSYTRGGLRLCYAAWAVQAAAEAALSWVLIWAFFQIPPTFSLASKTAMYVFLWAYCAVMSYSCVCAIYVVFAFLTLVPDFAPRRPELAAIAQLLVSVAPPRARVARAREPSSPSSSFLSLTAPMRLNE